MTKYIFLLFLLSSCRGDDNILLKKPVYANSYEEYKEQVNDGNLGSCFFSERLNVNWVIINLENIVQVKKIVIHSQINNDPISVYITDDFQPCQFHKQYKNYTFCKLIITKTIEINEFECDQQGLTGQFLVFIKGDYSSIDASEALNICEVKAYGKLISKSKPKERPNIKSESLPPISINDFKISKEIRRGVTSVIVPEYSQSLSYLGDCNPLIWDKAKLFIFSAACQTKDGKGRLVTFGKNNFFQSLVEDKKDTQFKNNLIRWLSPNENNPSIISKDSLKSMEDLLTIVKKGDILDFNVNEPYPNDVLNEIVEMVQNGSLSINMDWTFFVGTSNDAMLSYMRIFNIFNINFNEDFITWDSDKKFMLKDNDFNDDILNIDEQIRRLVKSHDYLLKNGQKIKEKISSFPNSIFAKSSIKSDLEHLIEKYDPLLKHICPCKGGPTSDPTDRKVLKILVELLKNQVLINSNYKFPCIDLFPGDFETTPEKKIVSLTFSSQTNSTDYPTGFYLEAGSTLKYIVHKSSGIWSMSVGCHTDVLDKERPKWSRYPDISIGRIELNKRGEIFSPFGGVLMIYAEEMGHSITITVFNVVATPLFNLRSKSAALDWEKQKNNPGLWGQIAGDNIVFCQETKKLKNYNGQYLERLMKSTWDPLVRMDHSLKSVNWKNTRPEHIVLDIMTSVGYGHSGYPIVVWHDWDPQIFNEKLIAKDGSWGMCHEIGHNMQEETWTFEDVVEVTNNVFCLFNYDKLWHLPRYGTNKNILRDGKEDIIKHLNGNVNYNSWKSNPWISLGIYSQLVNNLGWGFYKRVFEYYKTNIKSLDSNEKKIAMWITITCEISKQNLLPIYEYWGVPFDSSVIQKVSKLPCFFPDDFFTKMNEKRAKNINSKYPNCNSVSIFNEDYDPKNDIIGMRPNFIQELSSKTLSKEVLSLNNFEFIESFSKSLS